MKNKFSNVENKTRSTIAAALQRLHLKTHKNNHNNNNNNKQTKGKKTIKELSEVTFENKKKETIFTRGLVFKRK